VKFNLSAELTKHRAIKQNVRTERQATQKHNACKQKYNKAISSIAIAIPRSRLF